MPSRHRARSLGIPDDGLFVLYVGRLNVQKGLPVLLDAMELILSARPDVYLRLAGIGPERDWLNERIAKSFTLAAHVQLLGPRDDVPGLLRASDLLVLPSLWEGMPNVVLEAMASRRAVVATAVEGSEDLVTPGATGWLVPPGDADALASALLDAVSDRARLSQFGTTARARRGRIHSLPHRFSLRTPVGRHSRAGTSGFPVIKTARCEFPAI